MELSDTPDARNALADLAQELRFTLTDIRGECCEASYEAVAKALRIVSDLAKVKVEAIKENPSMVGGAFINLMAECRAIAAE